ncbi:MULTISPECIES: iron ABC transporter ATP-binding protein [Pacificibacter]|uniref:iron ABC transporter ATP-binding protein n=1 Tax=Pacificibacter TaxID=1042323 RepID=UPI001C096CFC|nr:MULTISPECIES: ATP-binding cassette domain-containing protein [Pacificibacter]MBU2936082.1 ATP-binding cassette domain-containing protein [Pacificibacter marinus]MDO6615069.1 ATP-binding cassette domain-containing protein [Pacificibacter sp. 1_MG-2023]
MICVEQLSHNVGKTPVLQNISLEIPKGKVTALVGPNGAGKSTLLSLIGRLMPLQTGRISVDGADIVQTPTRDLARMMAVLSQTNTLGSRLRVRELVGFGRWPHHQGRPTNEDEQLIAQALEALDLTTFGDRFLEELSGGQRQRAFIAMTLAQGADWLLLDEPLAALDMAFARRIMAQLAALREAGRSVVVVVHDINHAAAWADHVIAMKAGRIAAQGPPEAVCTSQVLGDIYDMELRVTQIEGKPLVLHHL